MVWRAVSSRGSIKLVILRNKVHSVKYCTVLESALLPFLEDEYGSESDAPVFQQDRAPSHSSLFTKDWMVENSITILDWPAMSPDLIVFENVWGWLSSVVNVVWCYYVD